MSGQADGAQRPKSICEAKIDEIFNIIKITLLHGKGEEQESGASLSVSLL